jgi:hypothetical protein
MHRGVRKGLRGMHVDLDRGWDIDEEELALT